MDITEFEPFEITSFELSGWRRKDGSIKLETRVIPEFPKEISCNDTVYTLEEVIETVKVNEETFCNAVYV